MANPPPSPLSFTVSMDDFFTAVVPRFDADGDGELNWTEVTTGLICLFGDSLSPQNHPRVTSTIFALLADDPLKDKKQMTQWEWTATLSIQQFAKLVRELVQPGGSATAAPYSDVRGERALVQLADAAVAFSALTGYTAQRTPPSTPGAVSVVKFAQRSVQSSPISYESLIRHSLLLNNMTLQMQLANSAMSLRYLASDGLIAMLTALNSSPSQMLLGGLGRARTEAELEAKYGDVADLRQMPLEMSSPLTAAARKAFEHIFSLYDADHDGVLTPAEALACSKQWQLGFDLKQKDFASRLSPDGFLKDINRYCSLDMKAKLIDSGLFARDLSPIVPPPPFAKTLEQLYSEQLAAAESGKPSVSLIDLMSAACSGQVTFADDLFARCDALVGRPFVARLIAAANAERSGSLLPVASAADALDLCELSCHFLGTNIDSKQKMFPEAPFRAAMDKAVAAWVAQSAANAEALAALLLAPETLDRLAALSAIVNAPPHNGGRADKIESSLLMRASGAIGLEAQYLWNRTLGAMPNGAVIAARLLLAYSGRGSSTALTLDQIGVLKALMDGPSAADVAPVVLGSGRFHPGAADFLRCLSSPGTPYPPILPEDTAALAAMSAESITDILAAYLGCDAAGVARTFSSGKYVSANVKVAQVVLSAAKRIADAGWTHGALAKRLSALVQAEVHGSVKDVAHAEALGVAVDTKAADLPVKVIVCRTMGHHQDTLHTPFEMQSYYLKSAWPVGGSMDCVLLARSLMSAETAAVSDEEWSKRLGDRLNARDPALWQKEAGVLYFSDMNPYLLRVACMPESEDSRYHLDLAKLIAMLKW